MRRLHATPPCDAPALGSGQPVAVQEEEEEEVEHTLYVCREVKVYTLPPRAGAGGHSSGTWRVDSCIFTGRLRMTARGHAAQIRLEDGASGELFALCPFTPDTQAVAIEQTTDSSRYYVLRVEDPVSKRHAFLGLGLPDRGAAFDFIAAVEDHAKQCKREDVVQHAAAAVPAPHSAAEKAAGSSWQDPAFAAGLFKDPGDLSLREGQTLKIDVRRPPSKSGAGGFLTRNSSSGGGLGLRVPSDGGGSSSGTALPSPPVLAPPPGVAPWGLGSPGVAPPAAAAAAALPAALPAAEVVASSVEGWATFD